MGTPKQAPPPPQHNPRPISLLHFIHTDQTLPVDLGGSLSVASHGLFSTGVSTDLNVTYIAPGGKIGDVLRAKVTCDKFGKTLAYTTATFWTAEGRLIARGSHTKFVALAWNDENNRVEEMKAEEAGAEDGKSLGASGGGRKA